MARYTIASITTEPPGRISMVRATRPGALRAAQSLARVGLMGIDIWDTKASRALMASLGEGSKGLSPGQSYEVYIEVTEQTVTIRRDA